MARAEYEQVAIKVPGSTANLGLYFDKGGAAISNWCLLVSLEPINGREIELQAISSIPVPKGRERGFAGVKALEIYLKSIGIRRQGLKLTIKDISKDGFPSGGSGSSGAESAGAIAAAAVLFGQSVSPMDMILASAKGEPGEHKDNVVPSVLGGIVFLSDVPYSKGLLVNKVSVPRNLGLAIGFSSHQKAEGTEGTRQVLKKPVASKLMVRQVGRAVAGALSLQNRNIDGFLQLVLGDEYHEPRRAKAGIYGNFTDKEFSGLKEELHKKYGIATAVSGAGPKMQFWFNKDRYPGGIPEEPKEFTTEWFLQRDITMQVEEVKIQTSGAYDYAKRVYPNSSLIY